MNSTWAIHTLTALQDNFIYVIEHQGQAVVVDPGEAAPVLTFLNQRQFNLVGIFLTHHHADHVAGTEQLTATNPCPVWCSGYDRGRLSAANHTAQGSLQALDLEWQVLELPGHTLGQIAYYSPKLGAVFTGDTLFSGGCGRLFEGSAAQMHTSLMKIAQLPGDTRIYFGHEYTVRNLEFVVHHRAAEAEEALRLAQQERAAGKWTTPTTVAREMEINPFLRAKSESEFKHWRDLRNHW